MKFSVGYQIFENDEFVDKIIEYKNDIAEVYFSWGDFPNGRNNQLKRADMTPSEAEAKQLFDLDRLSAAGLRFNILFNATCYGGGAQSRALFERVGDTVDFLAERIGLSSVTTASPLIASFIKKNFEGLEVRASVNMEIGSELGIEYLADSFDGFYLKRELNRDFNAIARLKSFCDRRDKRLYALANSGCLNNCSAHNFHDNLVSHESEIAEQDNGFEFVGVCRKFLTSGDNMRRILDCTNFIRPEDVSLYEGLFPHLKLATRVNANPMRVLDAYIGRGRHLGSTLDLLEPNHTGALYPYMLENSYIKSELTDGVLRYENIDNALIKLGE